MNNRLSLLGDEEMEVRYMVGNYIPKSITKATVFKILMNFPPFLSLLFRVICRQSNLHSCKESNYRFPSLFLEKNVKAPVYPVASCEGSVVPGFANTDSTSVVY